MTAITTYLYKQIVHATITDTLIGNTMTMHYSPNLKIHRGIDNDIRIQFKNRDQKKVNMAGMSATFVISSDSLGTTLLERTLTPIYPNTGVFVFFLTETDVLSLGDKFYRYGFRVVNGEGRTQIGYADDNYGAGGNLEFVDSVYPTFKTSTEETFGSGDTGSTIYLQEIINRNAAVHTAEVFFSSEFTGSLEVQASLNPTIQSLNDDDFVTISTETYTAQSDPVFVNFTGVYSAVRFKRSTTSGTLNKVLYRP